MTDPLNNPGPSGSNSGVAGDLVLRLVARIIDAILLVIVGVILGFVMDFGNAWMLLQTLIIFGYYVFMDSQKGYTIGKKILGLSVQGPTGGKPTVGEAAIRESFNLLGIIPILGSVLSLVAAIAIAVTIAQSPTKQGIHDQIAKGTRVVKG